MVLVGQGSVFAAIPKVVGGYFLCELQVERSIFPGDAVEGVEEVG